MISYPGRTNCMALWNSLGEYSMGLPGVGGRVILSPRGQYVNVWGGEDEDRVR